MSGSFTVNQVDIGIEVAISGSGSGQPIAVKLHTLNGPMGIANLTLIGSADTTVPDVSLVKHTVAVFGIAPAGSTLVVEMVTPDGSSAGNALLVGSNASSEGSPTYVMAADCALAEPAATTGPEIGQPQMHWVLQVRGTVAP